MKRQIVIEIDCKEFPARYDEFSAENEALRGLLREAFVVVESSRGRASDHLEMERLTQRIRAALEKKP